MTNEKAIDNNSTFNSDSPIESPEQDIFKRVPFAQGIAKVITNRVNPDSIVFGIYGEWGTGKTSVLNLIENELKKSKKIQCVKFNPWRFEDESSLILCFFESLSVALNKAIGSKKEKVGKLLVEWGELLVNINKKAGAFIKIGKKLSSVTLEQKMERLKGILREEGQEGRRIVVFIDDIDRLDKNEIQAVFKLVKLTANLPRIIYILAFDDKMVAAALNEKYASDDFDLKEKHPSGNSESGRNFLEKIVQVPLPLPEIDSFDLTKFCLKLASQNLQDSQINLEENEKKRFEHYFHTYFSNSLKTPRICIRYANRLSFVLPLLKGEINPADLMLIEGIRTFQPKFFEKIIDNKELFLGQTINKFKMVHFSGDREKITDKNKETFKGLLESLSLEERVVIEALLLHIFPKLEESLGDTHYNPFFEQKLQEEQRIGSPDYFNRYLAQAVPEYDISDHKIKQFLSNLPKQPIEDVIEALREMITEQKADKVISKLSQKAGSLSEEISENLSRAIAACAELYPNSGIFLTWLSAINLVYVLLSNIPKRGKRLAATQDILINTSPLNFAAEFFGNLIGLERNQEIKKRFSDEEIEKLGTQFAERIKEEAEQDILYLKYPERIFTLLNHWRKYSDKEDLNEHLRKSFKQNKQNVIEYLKAFLSIEVIDGIRSKSDFEKQQFERATLFLEPKIVYDELKKIYGDKLDENVPTGFRYKDIDERVAFQFAAIFRKVEKVKKKKIS